MTNEIIQALKLPIGFIIHGGLKVKCSGIAPSAASDPVRHLIGTFEGDADTCHAVGNSECDDSVFTLDPSQAAFSATDLKCVICGQSPAL